jgi:protein-tyrosine phosphatase
VADRSPFTVVIVCTGNVCRSPLTEQLLRSRFQAAGVPALVSSAGTDIVQGLVMPDEVVAQSRRFGGDPTAHAPRALDAAVLREADLVLAATREHRSAIARALPRAARYTFTIAQFARLVESLPPIADPWDLVAEAAAERGAAAPPENPDDDDIEDPYRRGDEVYGRVGDRIAALVDTIASRLIAPATGSGSAPFGDQA